MDFFYTQDHRQITYSDMERMELTLSNGKVVEGYAVCGAVDASYGLHGFKLYQIRHGNDDWSVPVTLERRVLVNHMCDFLTKTNVSIPKSGYREIEDWNHI